MRLTRVLLLVALFPLGLVACSYREARDVSVTPDDVTTAYVLNTNTFPVTVYLSQAGMRHRLGVVESGSAGTFEVPAGVLAGRREFRMIAAPLGPHPTFVSETFLLQPGQSADWRVREITTPSFATISFVSVR